MSFVRSCRAENKVALRSERQGAIGLGGVMWTWVLIAAGLSVFAMVGWFAWVTK